MYKLKKQLINFYLDHLYFLNINPKKLGITIFISLSIIFIALLTGYKLRDKRIKETDKKNVLLEKNKLHLESDISFLEDNLTEYNRLLKDGDYYRYMALKHSDIKIPKTMDSEDLILIHKSCRRFHIPYRIIFRLIQKESRYKDDAKSQKGARGYMQIMPATFNAMKNRYNKKFKNINHLDYNKQNIIIGTYYLSYLYKKYGRWDLTLSAYNAGPGNVNGKIPRIKETINYVKFINN